MHPERPEFGLITIPEAGRMTAVTLPEADQDEGTVPLSHYLWVLKRSRWRILPFIAFCTAAALLVSLRITPVYESTATIDVDRQTPSGVIGQESVRTSFNDADQFLATQIRLLQSDSVLRPVADRYDLAREEWEAGGGFLRLPGETSPARREAAPVMLKSLRITRPANTYLLQVHYRSRDPQLAAKVANAVADSYLEHTYSLRIRSSTSLSNFMEKQLDELKAKMERSSQALVQFERELNVVNPEEKTNILGARVLQLNTEYTSAQSERVGREAVRGTVQSGALEAAQASPQGADLRRIEERLNEALENFAQVRSQYGANHPEHRKAAAKIEELRATLDRATRNVVERVEIEYRQAADREAMLGQAVTQAKAEMDGLNARSHEYQALKQEAAADKDLYDELVRKIKEAGINAGFQTNSIRLADSARPTLYPVSPRTKINVLLALVLSSLAAFLAAVVSDVLDNTVRDPEHAARALNVEVIGSLPAVRKRRALLGPTNAVARAGALIRASEVNPELNGFDEAVRTLRNSILLSDLDRRIRSLLITSAAPGEGKSTMGAYLAWTHAQQGHRTLLIDGDLRRPSVHKRFGIAAGKGLSDFLTAEHPWRDLLIRPEGTPHLCILPAGPAMRRAPDLIGRGLAELLEEASEEFDLVILDGPPLLGFAEPLQMATVVDGVIVVTRAGETHRRAVGSVLAMLRRLRANVIGLVLNEVREEMSDSYYYYAQYAKYYQASGRA
jgi:capsular exopolysaccharide synthesis family protein